MPSPHPIAVAPLRHSLSCSLCAIALSITVVPRHPSPLCSRRAVPCRARPSLAAVARRLHCRSAAPSLAVVKPPRHPLPCSRVVLDRPSPSCSLRAVAPSIAIAPHRPSPSCSRRAFPCHARTVPRLRGAVAPSLPVECCHEDGNTRSPKHGQSMPMLPLMSQR